MILMAVKKAQESKEFNIDLLKDIVGDVGGKNSSVVVDLLYGKQNVNEFLIAKKLDLTINQTRNVLYKLSDEGLVSSVRKKDKKKGWYTYFWTFNVDKALILLKKNILRDMERLEHQLDSRIKKSFYKCKVCGVEVTEETALSHDFTCLECGEIYELSENKHLVNDITNQINKLKRKLIDVDFELEILESKKLKRFEVENKKLETEKAKKRAEKRAINKLAKAAKNKDTKKVIGKKGAKKNVAKKKISKVPNKKIVKKKDVDKKVAKKKVNKKKR